MSRAVVQNAESVALTEFEGSESPSLRDQILCLHDLYRSRLIRYVISMGLTPSDAEDVVQEAFLSLYRHLLAGRPGTNLPGWIFRVAHRLALKRRVRYRVDGHDSVEQHRMRFTASEPNPEEEAILNEQQNRLRRIFQVLPEMDRLCLQLRAEGLKYREIAGVLNISLGSVYNSLERSLGRMR